MKRAYAIAGLIALGVTAWILSGQFSGAADEAPANKPAAQIAAIDQKTAVRVRQVSPVPHQVSPTFSGQSEAVRSVNLKVETYGRIIEILAEEGQAVKEGELLLRLSEDARQAHVKEAEALVAQRRIEYNAAAKLAKSGYRSETELQAAAAALQAAQAQLEAAKIELANTALLAPFDGTIERHLMEIGDYADRGQAVMRLVQLDPLIVAIDINERGLRAVTLGGKADIAFADGKTAEGEISFISSEADPNTRTYRVELSIANPGNRLSAGMSASVSLRLPPVPAVKVSPAILSLDREGRVGVKLVGPDNKVVFQPVEIIDDEGDGVWVFGVPLNATLIVVGQDFVEVGDEVEPVQAASDGSQS